MVERKTWFVVNSQAIHATVSCAVVGIAHMTSFPGPQVQRSPRDC